MPERLPSLTALRAFVTAARHKSFSKAAEELSVTPAAVGFQIKQLEEEVGGPLFIRKHRAIELTLMGEALARDLAPAFDAITSAWAEVGQKAPDHVLRITAPENAVLNWLIPATTAARSDRPGPKLAWDATRKIRDFGSNSLDVAVRHMLEPDDRFFCEPVLRTWFTPLMRPEVARLVHRDKDILRHGLIDVAIGLDGLETNAWPPLLKLLNLPPVDEFAATCPETATALELASKTNHVAIGGYFVATKYLQAGSLVSPIPKAVMPRSRFWLVCAKGRECSDEIRWLRDVLHASAERLFESAGCTEFFELDGNLVERRI